MKKIVICLLSITLNLCAMENDDETDDIALEEVKSFFFSGKNTNITTKLLAKDINTTAITNISTKRIVTGDKSGKIHIINIKDGNKKSLKNCSEKITSLASLSKNYVIAGSKDSSLTIWKITDKQTLKYDKNKAHGTNPIQNLLTLGKNQFVSSCKNFLKIWDVNSKNSPTKISEDDSVNLFNYNEGFGSIDKNEIITLYDPRCKEKNVLPCRASCAAQIGENMLVIGSLEQDILRLYDVRGNLKNGIFENDSIFPTTITKINNNRIIVGDMYRKITFWSINNDKNRSCGGDKLTEVLTKNRTSNIITINDNQFISCDSRGNIYNHEISNTEHTKETIKN